MNITHLLSEIDELTAKSKSGLSYGNDYVAEQNLVKLRKLLNEQSELEADGSCESTESSDGS